ncbi:methylmalonyl Co-A mutase-associated GTPase MeaB [Congregibacter variabilis]|uniref:Methylmalonyl Co-A mutase-associated GTPase MeaB n=1 Tax=Congregibacter variabilis TaxID=3081200 RepID=A0ABZ0I2R1_9GAMM|nr:methylmalonyl Co-A mutase-associated GTPase MeaB [Congregibacter sp. IMCC43200]
MLERAHSGDRRALARVISAIERGERLPGIPLGDPSDAHKLCVGITGAPGAGKSTLVSALTDELLKTSPSAAVLAVDPSSPISRGALLGDRVRMHRHATRPEVFIRSMATRSHHGGLAGATQASRRLLQYCDWPLVLIETVGVGQVELDIVNTADIAVVVLNPGWGDEIQANKAGLMEIADIFVINKADRPGLESTRRDIDAVIMTRPESQRPPVIETVATEGVGMELLAEAIASVHRSLMASGELARRRYAQLGMELSQQMSRRFAQQLQRYEGSAAFVDAVAELAAGSVNIEAAIDEMLPRVINFANPGQSASGTDRESSTE